MLAAGELAGFGSETAALFVHRCTSLSWWGNDALPAGQLPDGEWRGVTVDIDGVRTEVPAKQLLMAAANLVNGDAPRVTPADLIPHTAVRKLRKLGFEVVYHEEM